MLQEAFKTPLTVNTIRVTSWGLNILETTSSKELFILLDTQKNFDAQKSPSAI